MILGVYSGLGFYGAQETTAQLSVTVNSLETSLTRPTITGTVSAESATVMVQVSGGAEYQAVVSGTSWSAEIGALAPGSYTISVTASDDIGSIPDTAVTTIIIILPLLAPSLIKTVYASAPSDRVLLATLEILVPGETPIRVVAAYEDLTATLETGEIVTFKAGPFEYKEPDKNTAGNQTLKFSVANVTGEAQRAVESALAADLEVPINYRVFVSTDLTAPAKVPYKMILRGGTFEGMMVSIEAGYFDLLNTSWPRLRYTTANAPGLRYI